MKKRSIILMIIFILFNLFIFIEALMPGKGSSEQSKVVTDVVTTLVESFGHSLSADQSVRLTYNLRKIIGHFGLFFVDGIIGYYFFKSLDLKKYVKVILLFSLGTFSSVVAELLQLIPEGRSCQFSDVMINLLGYVCSVLILMLIYKLSKKSKEKSYE